MARSAPGADRTVAVLDLLANHPRDRFTLSEVARRCHLNKATAHALLSALVDHGVLLRHPQEKRYSLGPRLIDVGEAARRGYSVLDFLPATAQRLATQTGTPVRATRVMGSYLMVVASAGGGAGQDGALFPRLPLVPPVGALFMAWADAPTVEAWLARTTAGESARRAIDALPVIRRLRVAVTPASPAWARLSAPVPPAADPPRHDEQRRLLAEVGRLAPVLPEIDEGATYRVADIEAPVFGPGGEVEVALGLTGLGGRETTGAVLQKLVGQVRATASGLTAAICGHPPGGGES
ncbi:MAG TPA: helix-turn-helix domain-containing protein [Acidimicrobiales bacterium]